MKSKFLDDSTTQIYPINMASQTQKRLLVLGIFLATLSCGRAMYRPDKKPVLPEEISRSQEATPQQAESLRNTQLQQTITQLNQRVEELDEEVSILNDKLERAESQLALEKGAKPIQSEQINSSNFKPNKVKRVSFHESPSKTDPEVGFTNNEAIQIYRQSKVLYETKKYSEAILAFTEFLREFPLHPLAGSAQYFIGESYYKRGEFKLARQEYQRVLSHHSSHDRVPETLKRISEIELNLKRPREANSYRKLLLSVFPNSPAAATTTIKRKPESLSRPPQSEERSPQSMSPGKEEMVPPTAPLPQA